MTITEAKKVRKAAASHFEAISKPGATCACRPCPICAAYNTMVVEAAEAKLNEKLFCPVWLFEDIVNVRAYQGHGRKAHLSGQWFEFDD